MATIYPKEFFKKSSKKVQRASCFVLMPFGDAFRNVYKAIKTTLESTDLNIECNRADDFHEPHIIETILKGICKAEYVIADLTESNANVFYELGLAHSYKDIEKVIIIAQDINHVPFDLRQFRCILYNASEAGLRQLGDELKKTFQEGTRDSFRIVVKDGRKTPFSKRLMGDGNYIYELEFESPYLGHDGLKLQIHFVRLAVDKTKTNLETQYLYLSENQLTSKINNIPWTVTLIRTNEREATISIDKN